MKIHYVTGSRADFGLVRRCLAAIAAAPEHELGIVVTGQHLVSRYGQTADEVRVSGLSIVGKVPVHLEGHSGAEMGHALAAQLSGLIELWKSDPPDLVLLLGDRGEMLAAALAAVHLGIFAAHMHGGERSGTLDDSFRHAISKLVHFHFPATEDAAERLIRMGERPDTVHVIGAPGLVGIADGVKSDRDWLRRQFDLPPAAPVALVIFHPVVQEQRHVTRQVRAVIEAVEGRGYSQLVLRPNSDAGGHAIDEYLDTLSGRSGIHIETHLNRDTYLQVLASSDILVGNSSSGIIESASFGIPCVNVGSRQNDRLRNPNTVDAPKVSAATIAAAIEQASGLQGPFVNLYGDGHADRRLITALASLQLTPQFLTKRNAY